MEIEKNTYSENNRMIKDETKKTIIISLMLVFSVLIYAMISIFLSNSKNFRLLNLNKEELKNIFNILNIAAILMVIIILTIRKTIFYSNRFIKDGMSLKEILMVWRSLDLLLLVFGESIALLGLVITLMGVPFGRSFHFFVTSILVILIIMPVNWKIRDKLKILEQHRDFHFDF